MSNIIIVLTALFFIPVQASEINYVPDEKTAIKIATAILSPTYGEEHVRSKAPYKATLSNGIWQVVGTLPAGYKGGVPLIQLNQSNAKVLKVAHG